MNLTNQERENYEKVSREAILLLNHKDELINDLRYQLEESQDQIKTLKRKLNEYENKFLQIEDNLSPHDLPLSLSQSTSPRQFHTHLETGNIPQNYLLSSQLSPNASLRNQTAPNFNKVKSDPEINQKYTQLEDECEKLKSQLRELLNEINQISEKNKNLLDLEKIYKQQIETLKKKNDNFDRVNNRLQEAENYINELSERYNKLDDNYEHMLCEKELEIKQSQADVMVLKEDNERLYNQLNNISNKSNENNMNNMELMKEIRSLSEINKDLEQKHIRIEMNYKEEIKKLELLLRDDRNTNQGIQGNNINRNINKSSEYKNVNSEHNVGSGLNSGANPPNSSHISNLQVEDLTNSLSRSLKDRLETQNKKISSQNVEILNLQYDAEKLNTEVIHLREVNDQLQLTLAEQKFKKSQTMFTSTENMITQTQLRGEDIDDYKKKIKRLEENLMQASEEKSFIDKNMDKHEETISRLEQKNKDLISENGILMKKMEKLKEGNLVDKEAYLNMITKYSKMNTTISALKLREEELVERLNYYEQSNNNNNNNSNNPSLSNNNLTFSQNQHQRHRSDNDLNNNNSNNNPTYQTYQNYRSNNHNNDRNDRNLNTVVSFNISEDDLNDKLKNSNQSKDLRDINRDRDLGGGYNSSVLNEKYELELKKVSEDNYYYKDQNFKLMSDIQRLQDKINKLKSQISSYVSDIFYYF